MSFIDWVSSVVLVAGSASVFIGLILKWWGYRDTGFKFWGIGLCLVIVGVVALGLSAFSAS